EPYAVRVELGDLALERVDEQRHEAADLVGRATPVLAREREERQGLDAGFGAAFDDGADRFDAGLMPGLAGPRPAPRPTAVAVHDDRDVARHGSGGLRLGRIGNHTRVWACSKLTKRTSARGSSASAAPAALELHDLRFFVFQQRVDLRHVAIGELLYF